MRPLLRWERETGVLSSSLKDHQSISPCQCHLSPELKMACEIKACLTGSVINATPLSVHHCHCSHSPTFPSPLLPLYITPTSLSPTPAGDMACASSTEQRKPKTRGILLKGVSQQPDINNLHVCRAESKPLGICGFTWVCACVSVCVPAFTPCVQHTSSCIMSPICAIKHS